MICKKIEYIYNFSGYNIIRKIEFDVKWHLIVLKQFYDQRSGELHFENLFESSHFTRETLSREFYEKFPECRICNYQITKFFTFS